MAWPPANYPHPFSYADSTPQQTAHPDAHNADALSLNDLVERLQALEAHFDDLTVAPNVRVVPGVGGVTMFDGDSPPMGRNMAGTVVGRHLAETWQRWAGTGDPISQQSYTFAEFANPVVLDRDPTIALVVVHFNLRVSVLSQASGQGPQSITISLKRGDTFAGNIVDLTDPPAIIEVFSPTDQSFLSGVSFYGTVSGSFIVPNPAEVDGKYLKIHAEPTDGSSSPVADWDPDKTDANLIVSQ